MHTLHTLAHPSGRGCAKGRPAPIGLKVRLHYVSARSEEVASGRGRLAHLAHLSGRTHPGGAPAGQQPTHSQPGSCVVCVGGLSTYTTFLYISRGKGCARCARPGSTFADRPETQRNRSLGRFGADHSFAHPSGQGCARVCKGVQMGAALTVGGEPASCSGDPAGSMRLAALRRSAAHRTVSRAV